MVTWRGLLANEDATRQAERTTEPSLPDVRKKISVVLQLNLNSHGHPKVRSMPLRL